MLAAVPPPVTVRVPAKINLHLAVGPLRADGYHDLVTVFHAVSLFDEVTVAAGDAPGIEVHGEGVSEVPADETNLAWRAVQVLAEKADREPDVRLVLRKGIPVSGGMAGGSADAAAALVGLSTLWKLDLTRDELSVLAAELGSDVTFALYGGTAVGTGRGEQIVPVLSRHTQHWVVAMHRGGLSTPAVFRELDRLRGDKSTAEQPADRPVEPVLEALAGGDPRQLALSLGNDLQAAAVSMIPDLRRTLRAGVAAGALAGLVSGSGPTCAFLCTSAEAALDVATELAGAGVCRTVRIAHGPVPGARVVDHDPPTLPPPPASWPPVRA